MRLSIDLSTRSGSLALHALEKGHPTLVAAFSLEGENRHSELLLSQLDQFLKKHALQTAQIKELVTALGPGSFTGMRIALSTCKAFSVAWEIPLFLLNTSEARARAFRERNPKVQNDIVILTLVASKTYSVASLSKSGVFEMLDSVVKESFVIGTGKTVLVDSEWTKKEIGMDAVVFPIHAEYLGEQLDQSHTRVDCKTFEDLVRAEPVYYGSSRF